MKVNRIEIIDHTKPVEEGGGRTYSKLTDELVNVHTELQDNDKTLKIFIE